MENKLKSEIELREYREKVQKAREHAKPCVAICAGTGCIALGAKNVIKAFREEVRAQGLDGKVEVRETGCPGFCEKGPVVVVFPSGYNYNRVQPGDAKEIVEKSVKGREAVERLLYKDPATGKSLATESEIPFYSQQKRTLMGNHIRTDPTSIEDYIALGGYSALARALFEMGPDRVLEEVKASELRGRGGAGFPTGIKWETTKTAKGDQKYVIVNCDEGDPGAFMNRAVMEGNPHQVLEGLVIGALAVGASEGYFYIREEYPLAVENTRKAIRDAEALGLLGDNILGSYFNFHVRVYKGAGAFVCGESTALMSSIEGKVGEPRPKYVRSAVKGLYESPTVLNNVETWANVPLIINNGAGWFKEVGTKGSKGTKIFALVGKVNNNGLVEVPMGATLRHIIYDIGGGLPDGKKFKAVQIGGPSGGCLPESMLDLPIDYDELTKYDAMMGSGGLIVMDEETCMVDVAKYFIRFLADESCGKCVPCREGLRQLLQLLEKLTSGHGTEEDVRLIEDLSEVVQAASLCALGQSAPNPVLSTLRHFRAEYEAHIHGECPALVCKPLIHYSVVEDACKGCGVCKLKCPADAISGARKEPHEIDQAACTKCGSCLDVCKFGAIRKTTGTLPLEAAEHMKPVHERAGARGK